MALGTCRAVLITGCNRGIGLGLVRGFLARSPSPDLVIATCRHPDQAQELQHLKEQHRNLRVLQLDVLCENSIKKAVQETETLVGEQGLNCLINNAGINRIATLDSVTAQDMRTVYETNTVAQLMVSKEFLPLLRKAACQDTIMGIHRAAIINMSSCTASMQQFRQFRKSELVYPYRIAKTALNMITCCLAADLISDGILCISMNPGWVKTDMGGSKAPLQLKESIPGILNVLANLRDKDHGTFLDWRGEVLPW
ncbi:C-factor-like [Trichosurus vulpecula]|uniref:C-factor-like n=1 Tax=Trichosurus vulpecula TaxID=9337 RepID=UPI00186B2FCD|nr:C-factor-like [Trichosurus vulpecula]